MGWRGRVVFSSSGVVRARVQPSGWWGEAATSLYSVLFPSACRLCSAPLTNLARLPVCEACLAAMAPIAAAVCSVCGERLAERAAREGDGRCDLCRRVKMPYVRAAAWGSYEGGLRGLIQLLKYDRVRPAAEVLGRMLAEVAGGLSNLFGARAPLVAPVPLDRARLRQRGFNQSELIARAAVRCSQGLELQGKALERVRATLSQTGLTRHQRRENMRGAFAAPRPGLVAGRDVLLVDDVLTTGATVAECARVLRRAGAERVLVATVARALAPEAKPMERLSH